MSDDRNQVNQNSDRIAELEETVRELKDKIEDIEEAQA